MVAGTRRRRAAREGRRAAAGRRVRAAVRVWVELFSRHNILTYASAIAFQTLTAAISLSLLALGVLGAVGRQDVWNGTLAPKLQHRVIPEVYAGIDGTVQQIFAHDSAGLIGFAAALALWKVSGGIRACMGALTLIYDATETRRWQERFALSMVVAAVVITGIMGALLVLVAVPAPSGGWRFPAKAGQWVASVLLVAAAFGVLARYAPAERRPKKWASVGAALVVAAWIVQTLVFEWYLGFANFKTAVGALALVLVATSYFYVGAIVLLVGIELDELLREDVKHPEPGVFDVARGLRRPARAR